MLVNKKNKRITGTIFNSQITRHIYEQVEEMVGQTVAIVGEMYETSYQDKKTSQWVNSYCVCINNMDSMEEVVF